MKNPITLLTNLTITLKYSKNNDRFDVIDNSIKIKYFAAVILFFEVGTYCVFYFAQIIDKIVLLILLCVIFCKTLR